MAITKEEAIAELERRRTASVESRIGSKAGPQPEIRAAEPEEVPFGEKVLAANEALGRAAGVEGALFQTGPAGPAIAEKAAAFKQGVKEEGPLFVGETAGEFVGAKAGSPALGAGLGRAGADAFVQISQQIANSPNAPKSSVDAAKRLLKQFAIGAGSTKVSRKLFGAGQAVAATREGAETVARAAVPGLEAAEAAAKESGRNISRLKAVVEKDQRLKKQFANILELGDNISEREFNEITEQVGAATSRAAKGLSKRLNKLARTGVELTPGQRTLSRPVQDLENAIETTLFSGGKLKDIKQIQQPAGVRQASKELLDKVLPLGKNGKIDRGRLGKDIGKGIEDASASFRKAGNSIYRKLAQVTKGKTVKETVAGPLERRGAVEVGEFVSKGTFPTTKTIQRVEGGVEVDIAPVKKFFQNIKTQRLKEGGKRGPIDTFIDDVLSRPDKTDLVSANNISTDFLELGRSAERGTRLAGLAKKATNLTRREIDAATANFSGEAKALADAARTFWKEGKETLFSDSMNRITQVLRETPSKGIKEIFEGRSLEEVAVFMNATRAPFQILNSSQKRKIRRVLLEDLVSRSSARLPEDPQKRFATLVGLNFMRTLDSLENDGALRAIFSPEQVTRMRNLGELALRTQSKTGAGHTVAMNMLEGGAVVTTGIGLASGQQKILAKAAKTLGGIVGVGKTLSAILTDPKRSRLLTDLVEAEEGTKQFATLATRFAREVIVIKREIFNREQQEQRRDTIRGQFQGFPGRGR